MSVVDRDVRQARPPHPSVLVTTCRWALGAAGQRRKRLQQRVAAFAREVAADEQYMDQAVRAVYACREIPQRRVNPRRDDRHLVSRHAVIRH